MSTKDPATEPRAPGWLLPGSVVFLAVSLGIQWFACLLDYGMGSRSFYPGNAVPTAVLFGLPTLAVLGAGWFFAQRAVGARVMLYGFAAHIIVYGLVLIDLATVAGFEGYIPSWVDRHPELLGRSLAAAGVLVGTATAALSFRARRFP